MLKSEPWFPNPGILKIVNEKLDEAFCTISQKYYHYCGCG